MMPLKKSLLLTVPISREHATLCHGGEGGRLFGMRGSTGLVGRQRTWGEMWAREFTVVSVGRRIEAGKQAEDGW